MTLTKGVIGKSEAQKLAPEYVKSVDGDWDALCEKVIPKFGKLKVKQAVLTHHDGQYVKARVSSIKPGFEGEPVVRVGNGEYTWRVDGADYAFPI